MKIKEDVLELAILFFESYTREGIIEENLSDEIKNFIIKVCIDGNITYDHLFDDDDENRIETLKEEIWKEILKDEPILWFALYLYNKGIITEEQIKKALNETKWHTCCHGDYIKLLEKRYGVKVNEK